MKGPGVLEHRQGLCTGIIDLIVTQVESEGANGGGVLQHRQGLCTGIPNIIVSAYLKRMKRAAEVDVSKIPKWNTVHCKFCSPHLGG